VPKVTKSGLRGFAAGILFSTAVLSFVYYSELPEKATSVEAKDVTKQGNTNQPTKAIQMPEASSNTENDKQSQNKPAKQPEKKVYTYRLVISKGMSPEEAAGELEKAHIIYSKKDLVKYLNDFSLMGSVRRGTYDLNSNMKITEIAKIITGAKAK
jgi:hypothetical protein